MLADAANHRSESTLHLPVDAIVEHVQQYDSLVSDKDVLVPEKLDKDLLNKLQLILVVVNLCYE